MRTAAVALGWAVLTLAVGCERPRTELVVRVDSEVPWGTGQTVQSVVLSVRRGGATGPLRSARTTPLGDGGERRSLPLLVGVVPGDDDTDTPVWIEALGCGSPNGCEVAGAVVVQRAVVRFARGQTQELTLLLASACVGIECPSDQRCAVESGRCETAMRAQEMVRPFGVDAAVIDAAVIDAAVIDAAVIDAADAMVFLDDRVMSDDWVDARGVIDSPEVDAAADAADVGADGVTPVDTSFVDLGSATDCALIDAACSGSSACCGNTTCVGGTCQCRARGQSCSASADCCSGMSCSSGVCSMCASLGSTCTPGGGPTCCSPSQCRMGLLTTYCCVQQDEGCARDTDCCGYMLCDSGRCTCRAEGRSCREDNECCAGLACQSGACRRVAIDGGTSDDAGIGIDLPRIDGAISDGGMCIAAGQACVQGSSTCCGDYSCAQEPAGTLCCHPAMGSCRNSLDCCGQMLCNVPSGQTTGSCVCRRRNEVCLDNLDCCGGATCNRPDGGTTGTCACSREFGTCTTSEGCCDGLPCRMGRCLTAGCLAPGERCDNTDAGSCCGGYACNLQPNGQSTCSRGPAQVESDPPTTCMMGSECAGSVLCTGGVCVCRRGGQSCFYSNDCCGAMLCIRPGGALTGMGTCQCQASGNGCRIGGNDCCSGACRSTPTGDRCP